jgi:1-acyl-sn-glycerol-3-phosphate acyltransferase
MNTVLTTKATTESTGQNILRGIAFFGGYLIFATVSITTSLLALPFSFLLRGPRAHRAGQQFICWLFAFFMWYLRICGIARCDFQALHALRKSRGLIIAANHPCLLDAVFVASELPRLFCLMKASLTQSPFLCGTSRLAGYVQNESGPGLVRQCRERLNEGSNLLVFPEGTRTRGIVLNEFRMGFALIAKHAGAPVQTIIIESNCGFLGKGSRFFKMPAFPLVYSIRLGKRFEPAPGMDARQFGRSIEQYFHEVHRGFPRGAP